MKIWIITCYVCGRFPDFGDLFNKKTPESYWRFDIQHTYGYGAAADMKTKVRCVNFLL